MNGSESRLIRSGGRWDRVKVRLRIARWEISRGAAKLDRRTIVAAIALLALSGGVASTGVGPDELTLDQGIYRVGVTPDSAYYPAVSESSALVTRPPEGGALARGELELLIRDGHVRVADSQKGRAALATLHSAVETYNERHLAAEDNATAAFPVRVGLSYVDRNPGHAGASSAGDSSDGSAFAEPPQSNTGGAARAPAIPTDETADGTVASPGSISPPFPFESLVLAFVFLVPMNFLIQVYGGSFLNERINRRGELLLVAPVSGTDIVMGKTLPYLAGVLAIAAGIAVLVGGGPLSVMGVLPIGLLYLAATFLISLFARSFKELTFLTVGTSVFLTTYAFVPAIFTDVSSIALISPLTIVVRDLQGQAVTVGEYIFSTGPFYASSVVLFTLGTGIYREEDLFTQRRVALKFLDALAAQLEHLRSVALWSALFVPLVFVAELLTIALLFVVPVKWALPTLLVAIACIEETAKSIHVYAGFTNGRFTSIPRIAVLAGGLSAIGFFVGEKFMLVSQLVGLPELTLGRAAFAPVGLDPLTSVVLPFVPLGVHAVTTVLTSLGASRGRATYLSAMGTAVGIHALYNFSVVMILG